MAVSSSRQHRPSVAKPKARRGYGGLTPEQMDQVRRRRLMDTALELFTAQGYIRTPIEQLCAASRVTSRYFYQLFDSREALLQALYDEIIGRTTQAVSKALMQPGLQPEARIAAAVDTFVHAYIEDPRHARLCVLEAVGVSPALEKRRREVIHDFARVVSSYADSLAQAGTLLKRDYHLFGVAMAGGINELLAEWLTVQSPPSIEKLTEEIQLLFKATILGGIAMRKESNRK